MESADVTAEYVAAVERIARAVFPVVMSQVTGREPLETYDTTITDNREAAREVARAALSAIALPSRELLAEALEALQVFAEKAGDYLYEDPQHHGVVQISDLRRARAAADKIRDALERQP
jgi:hypothetical protein